MSRKNMFEILKDKWNLEEETDRLLKLFSKYNTVYCGLWDYNLESFVENYCFYEWKNRGRYIDVNDYLNALGFEKISKKAKSDAESFILLIEIIYNFYYMAMKHINSNEDFGYYSEFVTLKSNMDNYLEYYIHMPYYREDKEQLIIIEKIPEITAVVEISDSDTACDHIMYNHYSLKGDITAKKAILLRFADRLEPLRKKSEKINKKLSDNIFFLFNNFNIRHNNCEPKSKNYKQYVAAMPPNEIEHWYDELYQMILLSFLEIDNLERQEKVEMLKTKF